MFAVKIVSVEIGSPLRDPGLVHCGELTGDLFTIALRVHVSQAGTDLHAGLADRGRTVSAEADGVIAAVAAAKLSLGNHKADGQACVDVVKIAVDSRHNTVPPALQLPGRGGDGAPVREDLTIGDNGRHVHIRHVCNQVLRPEVVVCRAPEGVGGELRLLVQQRVHGRQILSQGIRRGGTQSQ